VDVCLAAGCHGIALLGLVTEVFRLSTEERLDLIGWAGQRIAGRVPLMATVAEVTVHGQLDFITEAKRRGADGGRDAPRLGAGVPHRRRGATHSPRDAVQHDALPACRSRPRRLAR
jgi:hypothetical protein